MLGTALKFGAAVMVAIIGMYGAAYTAFGQDLQWWTLPTTVIFMALTVTGMTMLLDMGASERKKKRR